MKKMAFAALVFALFLALMLTGCEIHSHDPLYTKPEKLPDVIAAHYGDSITPRNVWDMEILDGRLYVSTGDYDKNSGRTPLFVYDISTDTWDTSYLTNDEALGDMRMIDGTLFIAGNDSCGDWDAANYYTVRDGRAEIHATLPNGAHCFDAFLYEGICYFGIGTVTNTDSPVIAYDGETYTAVPFFKDGVSLFSDEGRAFFRAYNFFPQGGELYALVISERQDGGSINYEIYRLEDSGFEFYSDLRGKGIGFYVKDGKRIYQNLFKTIALGEETLFTSGRLFSTADFLTYEELTPEGRVVSDLYAYGDRVFVLSFEEEEKGSFMNTVSEYVDGELVDLCRFSTLNSYALSLAYDGESFFVGTGGLGDGATPGDILKIQNIANI
ncbi:MAG: hypothetical protein IKV20_00880 [Clostridia bacterium]|nr:hypothetical protein [Clostridia bacterium]